MKNNIKSAIIRDERISRYLKGQMDTLEEIQFLTDMESDKLLKQDAITQAQLIRGMAQVDSEVIQALKQASESIVVSSVRPHKKLFRSPIAWVSIAASVAVLVFVSYKGYDYYDTTRLGMKYATALTMETSLRGDTQPTIESDLQNLFDNIVKRKNLRPTIQRLSELWNIANQDIYNDYTDYAPYIGWYLAIGYLENYEKDEALRVFHKMLGDTTINISIKNNINKLFKEL